MRPFVCLALLCQCLLLIAFPAVGLESRSCQHGQGERYGDEHGERHGKQHRDSGEPSPLAADSAHGAHAASQDEAPSCHATPVRDTRETAVTGIGGEPQGDEQECPACSGCCPGCPPGSGAAGVAAGVLVPAHEVDDLSARAIAGVSSSGSGDAVTAELSLRLTAPAPI